MTKKEEEEVKMKENWMKENANQTDQEVPQFEYYDFENWFLINYYWYLTATCQGKSTSLNDLQTMLKLL